MKDDEKSKMTKHKMTKHKMTKHKFDPVSWAENTPRIVGGVRCGLCSAPRDAQDAIIVILDMRDADRTNVSQVQVCKMLLEEFGVKVAPTSLVRHITGHMGRSWSGCGK